MFKSISSIGLLNVIIKALFTLRLGDVKIMYLVLLFIYSSLGSPAVSSASRLDTQRRWWEASSVYYRSVVSSIGVKRQANAIAA